MTTSAQVNAMFEASTGEPIDEVQPVFIGLRGSDADLLLVSVRVADRAMTATYDVVDPKLDHDDVTVLFCETYLRRFSGDQWRERVDTITLVPREPREGDPPSPFAYPSWEDDEPDAEQMLLPLVDVEAQILQLREHVEQQLLLLDAPTVELTLPEELQEELREEEEPA